MTENKKPRNGLALLVTLVSLVVSVLVIGSYVVAIAGDNADTKRRVDTVEKRQAEDRAEIKQDQKEIKADVKDVKSEVQQIRILLERMGRERSTR